MGILMLGLFSRGLDRRLARADLPPEARTAIAAQRQRLAAVEIPAGLSGPARTRAQAMVQHAFLDGFRGVMLTAAGLALFASLSAAWLIRSVPQAGDESPG